MKIVGRMRQPKWWKRMGVAAARLIGEELAERVQSNLTPAERRELGELALRTRDELGELALWTRDELRDLAGDPESRRLGQLVAKALNPARTGAPRRAATGL
jgi:hypothetical protein